MLHSLQVSWLSAASSTDSQARQMHSAAQLGSWRLEVGQAVLLPSSCWSGQLVLQRQQLPALSPKKHKQQQQQQQTCMFGLLQCMWEDDAGVKQAQVSHLAPSAKLCAQYASSLVCKIISCKPGSLHANSYLRRMSHHLCGSKADSRAYKQVLTTAACELHAL